MYVQLHTDIRVRVCRRVGEGESNMIRLWAPNLASGCLRVQAMFFRFCQATNPFGNHGGVNANDNDVNDDDARALAQVYIGIPQECVLGVSIKEQIQNLDRMTWSAFLEIATDKGFIYKSTVGQAVILPPRFMMINASLSSSTHGIRWQLFGSEVTMKMTYDVMSKAISENPSLKRHTVVANQIKKLMSIFD